METQKQKVVRAELETGVGENHHKTLGSLETETNRLWSLLRECGLVGKFISGSGFQNWERNKKINIKFCQKIHVCPRPLSMWPFVLAGLENEYSPHQQLLEEGRGGRRREEKGKE